MGYTHYFTSTGETKFHPEALKIFKQLLDEGFKKGLIVEGLSAPSEKPFVTSEYIQFNGIKEDGHETFQFRLSDINSRFCKTARKPYDEIVTKVLLTIKWFHPNVDISSDGDMEGSDWAVANGWAKNNLYSITKKSMDKKLQDLVNEALSVKGKISRIEKEVVSDLKELLKKLAGNILAEMKTQGLDGIAGDGGHISIVNRKGSIKLDVDMLMSDLDTEDLKKYESRGKGSEFLQYNLDK